MVEPCGGRKTDGPVRNMLYTWLIFHIELFVYRVTTTVKNATLSGCKWPHLGNMTTFVRSYVQFVDQHDVPNRSQGMQLIPGTMKWERVKIISPKKPLNPIINNSQCHHFRGCSKPSHILYTGVFLRLTT